MNRFTELSLFGPKVLPIDGAMREPERAMVFVIMLFIRGAFHGPIPRHGGFARTEHRVAIGPRHIPEKVFREQTAVKLNSHPVGKLDELDTLLGGRTGSCVQSR